MSLRLRLALWYGGLTGLVVLLVSLLTYGVHSRAHYDQVDRALVSAATHTATEVAASETPAELAAVVAGRAAPEALLRIYDAQGQVLAASPNADAAPALDPHTVLGHPSGAALDPLVALAPPLLPVDAGSGIFGVTRSPTGERWRVYVLPVGEGRQFMVGMAPLEGIDAAIVAFRDSVPVFAALGAVVTLNAGWLLASRALRPVAAVTTTARGIAESRDFTRRVPVDGRQDELGRMATTFNEMLASLDEAYAAQQRFVADASHELRAPLTAIQGNLELLERQQHMPEAAREEAVAEASREARRLANLVSDLLALARADAGVPLRRQPVEMDRLLVSTAAEARHLARGQQVEVAHLEPAVVQGDPDRLKQLLLILLDNALKYTPPTGRVSLELRRDGATAVVHVRDTGVGIAPEDIPHVFERFYRADPARGRDPGGTGLGLPIARWIAEQHGGRVTLASTPGQGTTATVRLPTTH